MSERYLVELEHDTVSISESLHREYPEHLRQWEFVAVLWAILSARVCIDWTDWTVAFGTFVSESL